ncbi:YdcF family protein [Halomonas sp. 18H]|uniref:SanA/YdcF family protein n=1 Tax=Halomonas almeriensis TaxID=308163 RepID=UPI0022303F72|nr:MULTISPECIES: ElyC/SanA/YdcF family protein [Halomonas]MCW4151519.1 YdcF family protein [Halomonas sp. 18H]MDN3552665.1 ElyC/SanA/YdcF family protein [Halomonas almeriensis]
MRSLPWKTFRFVLMLLGGGTFLAILLFLAGNLWVLSTTRGRIEPDPALCQARQVAIVFGTSHWTRSGMRNPHFEGRMQAAASLIEDRKIEHLLLSGDNSTRYYNEPITMWKDLLDRGVPESAMTLDYAGFSTFDTLTRARDVFAVNRALLVTQDWHLPRALFIADKLGVEARGCVAPTRPSDGTLRLRAREWVARLATLGDLYVWGREPHFLGPREPLQIAPDSAAVSDADPASEADTARESERGSSASTPR